MSITDELRSWADGNALRAGMSLRAVRDQARAIADRIDAEHQKGIRELNNLADASVLLPVDANGERIHVGDMMERGKARGHVIALMLSNYPKKWGGELHWGVQLEGEQAPTALDLTFHHYHAPTVEDVLREFAMAICKDDALTIRKDVVDEYASKLRLAYDEDER